jgi:Flp pilus assembly pilin Flp
MSVTNHKTTIHKFKNEEDGIEAIQAIVILAIGGVALLTLKPAWNMIGECTIKVVDELLR